MDPVQKARIRDNNFSMPPLAAVMRVLQVNLRGTHRVKPEGGEFRIPFDPGSIGYVLFLKAGVPLALGICETVTPGQGDWMIKYTLPKWLKDEE